VAERKGIENLIPQSERTKEEQRKIATMGGIASGKVRKEKATLRKTMLALLDHKIETPLSDKKLPAWEAITLGQIKKAVSGDTAAYNAIRDIIGEKPVDKQETANTFQFGDKERKLLDNLAKRLNGL
jgi:hypothetical protein